MSRIDDVTFAKVSIMSPGEYYIEDGYCHIIAKSVDIKQIIFTCPCCSSKYKKDGNPCKNAKKVEHIHTSSGYLGNRLERRAPHCQSINEIKGFIIYITDRTERQ